jgi:HSP20 family protein
MADTAAKQAKKPSETEVVPVKRGSRRAVPALVEPDFFDDFFEDLGRGFFRLPSLFRRRAFPALAEMPRVASVDVYQTDDEVIVEAEMPGVSKDDIEVTVDGSTLTLKGEKKQEREVKEENYYRSERSFGMVSRTIELPADVKSEQATAKITDGVLKIQLPKTEEAKRKAVKLKVQ